MTKNSPPQPDSNEPLEQHAPLKKNTESHEDFPTLADVLKSQYIDNNSQYSTAEQLTVLNKVADAARERVLRIWTEKGMAGKDSDAYFKMCADAVKREMEKAGGGSKTPSASVVTPTVSAVPATEAATSRKSEEEFVPQNTNNGALTEDIAERDLVTSQAATATTPPASPAKTSQTAVVSPRETSHEDSESLEFDPKKWKGTDLSARDAYKKYVEKVSREADSAIKELGSIGATDGQKQENERVVRSVLDHVIDAAQSQGPIQFTRYLKLDREFKALRSGRSIQTPAQQKPQAVVAREGESKTSLKDFSELAVLRGTPLTTPETDTASTDKGAENGHQSATHEPPPAIEAVSGDVPLTAAPKADPISPEDFDRASQEKAAAERLNTLKKDIDKQHDTIRTLRAENKDDVESKKRLAYARRTLDKLHLEAKNIAVGLVGKEKLFGLVKPADDVATKFYKSKIPVKVSPEERKKLEAELPEGAADAYYEAGRRRNGFAEVLDAKGVERGVANDLYREFVDRAKGIEWLKGELEGGRDKSLTGSRARDILEWHGIKARQPKQVLEEITPILNEYHTVPPKQERPRREAEMLRLHREHVLQVVQSGEGKTVPWEVLKKYSQEPEIAAFMKAAETALTPFPVTIAPDNFGMLLFHTWKNKIPEGVQVGTASGGGTSAPVEEADEDESSAGETLQGAWLDLDSFEKQCSVSGVSVKKDSVSDHCRVYINFDVDKNPANAGLHAWGNGNNDYAPLLRSLLGEKYKNVRVSWSGKKVTLRFSDERIALPSKTKTKIVFVAEQGDSSNSSSGATPGDAKHVKSLKDNSMKVEGTPVEEVHVDDVATPAESVPALVADAGDLLGMDRKDMPTVPTLTDEVEPTLVAETTPVNPTEAKTVAPLDRAVLEQFEKKFGITEEMLQNITAFEGLKSVGKQLLVLKNLEQIALTDIKKDAQVEQKKEFKEKPWWMKLILNAGTAGSYGYARTKGIEKELLAKARGGNNADPERAKVLAEHLANIEELTKVAAEGPDVDVDADGELNIKYISPKDIFGAEDVGHHTLPIIAEFNTAASTFAKLPREWGYEPKDEKEKKENKEYLEKKAEYERAREEMLTVYQTQFEAHGEKDPEKAALLAMSAVDERMELNQLFNAHPNAEKALANIKDQSVIREGLKDFWRDKGKYLALGAAIRIGAVYATGGLIAPLAAIGLGGAVGGFAGDLQGRNEAKKLIRERRIDRRMSEEDEREKIVATDKEGNVIKDENGKPLERKIKEYTDATFFTDRIERLSLKLEQATDPKERELLEARIVQTAVLMREKYERGLINFGGSSLEESDKRKGNTIANRLSFIEAIGKGQAVEILDLDKLQAEMARITGIVDARQEKITDLEKKEISRAAGLAGWKRMGYALAGGYLGGRAMNWLKESDIFSGLGVGGSVERFNPDQVKAVTDAIRNAPNTTRINGVVLPDELVMPGREADVKAFQEYMTDTNATHRAQLLEVIGKTKEQMDARIAELLAKGHTAAIGDSILNAENAKGMTQEQLEEKIAQMRAAGMTQSQIDAQVVKVAGPDGTAHVPGLPSTRPPWLAPNEEIVSPESVREGTGGVVSSPVALGGADRLISDLPLAEEPPGSELLPHRVVSGDSLTKILKTKIPELSSLSPKGQDNAIQNLLKSLSPEELRAIGGPKFTDPNTLAIDQTIDLNKVIQLLHEKKIDGENLLERAAHLEGEAPVNVAAVEGVKASEGVAGAGEVPRPAGTPLSMEETAVTWNKLPEEMKLPQAQLEAGRYLDADVERLFPKPLFAPVSPEWLSIRDRDALLILETDPRTLSGTPELSKAYDWPTVARVQQYIAEQGITKEKGYMPTEKETLADFLKRALAEKVLRDGPSRPFVVGRTLH